MLLISITESVYVRRQSIVKKTVNTNGLTVNTLQCKIELWKMNFFLDPPVSILKAMNRKERLDI